jgi:hypothetical protein
MRLTKIIALTLILCEFSGSATAADQAFNAPEAGDVLHGVDGRTYWEMFAVCFASANAALEKAAADKDQMQQRAMDGLAASVLARGIARLVTDRAVFEGEAEEVFYARAAQFMPVADFADACRLYIQDHDSHFGAPK